MRKLLSAALAASLAFALSACSDDDATPAASSAAATSTVSAGATPSATASSDPDVVVSSDGMPTLDTSDEDNPVLKFPDTAAPDGLQVSVVSEGDGRVISGDDYVIVDYVGQVWGDSTPFDSSFTRGAAAGFWLKNLVSGWKYTLEGHHVGSKVIISLPPEYGYGSSGNDSAGISGTDTIAFYIEVHDALSQDSSGQDDASVEIQSSDLPVTITGDIGSPVTKLAVKDGEAEPKEVTTKLIAKGTGAEVPSKNAIVYLNYAAVSWDGDYEENSWLGTPEEYTDFVGPQALEMGANSTIFDGLAGVPVGSRVLVLVPAQEASDDTTTSTPAMAVVVDVLAISTEAPSASASPTDD
ncbi:MAG: FKBP-type peptidyl-prolyl cis-trans isomerase [Ancrocorticia sp.]|jgi:peptidylprolyl isomerase|nr:FKBP-type peptidyl-prolyl cis-trans isomerase [Ancrocorticia sp.]MCI2002637.1 FKBP-type peptidyl-prolyl cis-trans isomerase [Ancrocorticia sp.]